MISIAFPNMFDSAKTNLIEDKKATLNNLQLLLLSDRWSLLGDPYYGASFKRALFEQNNVVIRDLMIDEIYITILLFMPQIKVERKDIVLQSDKENLYANIRCTYRKDGTTNLYTLVLNTGETTNS